MKPTYVCSPNIPTCVGGSEESLLVGMVNTSFTSHSCKSWKTLTYMNVVVRPVSGNINSLEYSTHPSSSAQVVNYGPMIELQLST